MYVNTKRCVGYLKVLLCHVHFGIPFGDAAGLPVVLLEVNFPEFSSEQNPEKYQSSHVLTLT